MVTSDNSRELGTKKLVAGISGIVVGGLGIHKFILGYAAEGWIMALTSVFTCGIGSFPLSILGLIERIAYLSKSDEEFRSLYVHNKKGWI